MTNETKRWRFYVTAVGTEADPELAAQARERTGREVGRASCRERVFRAV